MLIGQHGPKDHVTLTSEFGVLVFEKESSQQGAILPGWSYFDKPLPRRFRKQDDLLGFAAYRGIARHYMLLPRTSLWGVSVPYWFLFSLTAAMPTLRLIRWRRRRAAMLRMKQGLCARCGYDLRASEGRCPECGMVLITNSAAMSRWRTDIGIPVTF
jgi:predicted RNA-binding Zn-ribbon protein involved in translation (DUF1610 family)